MYPQVDWLFFVYTHLSFVVNEMWELATCAIGVPNVVPVAFKDVTEEGKLVDSFKEMVEKMFQGAATAKGALVITPSKVIVTTPGADNKKEI